MLNGTLPYDEFHNLQHKQHYTCCVPSQRAVLLILEPKLSSPPWAPQAQHTVQIALGTKGKEKKGKQSIKPDKLDANCALIFKLFPGQHKLFAT